MLSMVIWMSQAVLKPQFRNQKGCARDGNSGRLRIAGRILGIRGWLARWTRKWALGCLNEVRPSVGVPMEVLEYVLLDQSLPYLVFIDLPSKRAGVTGRSSRYLFIDIVTECKRTLIGCRCRQT